MGQQRKTLTVGPTWVVDIGVTEDTQFHKIQSVFKEVHITFMCTVYFIISCQFYVRIPLFLGL